MIDLHTHVLPAIDDGAGDWREAVEMCRMAAADGCEALVATPHQRKMWVNERPERIVALARELQERAGPRPRIYPGAEIHVDSEILDELSSPDRGGLVPLADGPYLLLEFGVAPPRIPPVDLVHELVVAGWRPLLAHPEFIPFLAQDLRLLAELVEGGARTQITAMSLTGEFGAPVQRLVAEMIDRQLVHVVASDAHSPTWRPPGLSEARRLLARTWGESLARRLTEENPRAVLEAAEMPASDPVAP